jgi:fused signal recognition particle receptor
MFKFLKDKLKQSLNIFSKKVEQEVETKEVEVLVEPEQKIELQTDNIRIEPKDHTKDYPKEPSATVEQVVLKKTPQSVKTAKIQLEHAREEQEEEKKKPAGFFEKLFSGKEKKETAAGLPEHIQEHKHAQAPVKAPIHKQEPEDKAVVPEQKHDHHAKTEQKLEAHVEFEKPPVEKTTSVEASTIKEQRPRIQEKAKLEIIHTKPEPDHRKVPEHKVLPQELKKSGILPEKQHLGAEKKEVTVDRKITAVDHQDDGSKPTGFFQRIKEQFTTFNLSESKFEELFFDLEVALLENNVAVEVIEKIKTDLKNELTKNKISRKNVEEAILERLKWSIADLFQAQNIDLLNEAKKKQPYIIAMIGVNGSGKTTTLAKLAQYFQQHHLSVVFAASDTFRAAAIQQLEEHANNLNIKMIKHDYHSDPAAVAFDAIQHAKARNIDVVIIDTAGRLHSNTNLMDELKKVVRVNKPDIKIFVGESTTGNDCVEQAKAFDAAVGIDAIILAKADVDEKGGAAISVSYVTKKPILFLGVGQRYGDLKPFDKEELLENLGL